MLRKIGSDDDSKLFSSFRRFCFSADSSLGVFFTSLGLFWACFASGSTTRLHFIGIVRKVSHVAPLQATCWGYMTKRIEREKKSIAQRNSNPRPHDHKVCMLYHCAAATSQHRCTNFNQRLIQVRGENAFCSSVSLNCVWSEWKR